MTKSGVWKGTLKTIGVKEFIIKVCGEEDGRIGT